MTAKFPKIARLETLGHLKPINNRTEWVTDMPIKVDIVKAQDITKDRLRSERKPLLESLDIQVMKNISNPVKLAEIETEKQRLRDITKQVDLLATVEELKSITCL